jgi:hydrophobic/amphiphilic exporter-1 (mainly G- bacteria), HAE1 family
VSPEGGRTGDAALRALFRGVVLHPVAMTMVFLAGLVFGVVSYLQLPVELMPDVSYPTLTVRTTFEGAAPQEVESQVSEPIESQLATLDGLVSLESRSRAGQSDVVLGFDWGHDMGSAAQSIREKLQIVFLPEGTERPLLLRYDPSLDPLLRIALALDGEAGAGGPEALYNLRAIAEEEVQRELEGLPGVAAVRIRGGLEREIRVAVRADQLAARRLTIDQLRQALATSNVNLAGGSILEGDQEYLVRTLNELRTVEQIRALRIRRADGTAVPLTDVATVSETHREREVVSHLDGAEAVELEVFKEADANIVEVARKVKDRLLREGSPPQVPRSNPLWQAPGVVKTLPDDVQLRILDDQAAFIEAAIDNLLSTALLGAVFAVGVLFLFLRDFRATAIIGLAIPVSVVVGFAPLYLLEVTLNLMSLGGLALGVGMLVDNAVVVLEAIQRYLEEGLDRVEAAVRGTADVALAVTASTFTTVAVFFPITFVEGVAGELFGDLAVAVVASLLASLAVALFLVPTLAALRLALPDAEDLPGTLGAWARRRREGFRGVAGAVGRDISGQAAQVAGRYAARLGLDALARRLGVDPGPLARRRWHVVGLPYILLKVVTLLVWGVLTTSLTVGLAFLLVALRASGRLVRATLGRGLLAGAGVFQSLYARFETRYVRALPAALRRPGLVVGLAALALLAAVGAGTRLGTELIPEVHQGRFEIDAALPVGTPLPTTVRTLAPVEARVAAHPDVETVYTTLGTDGGADAEADEGEHTATLRVQLRPPGGGLLGEDVEAQEDRVMEEIRRALGDVPRLDTRFSRPSLFAFDTPIEVVVFGYDLDALSRAGDRVARLLRDTAGLRDVRSSLNRGFPEVQIRYDRDKLIRLGLDPDTIATRIRDKVQGARATDIQRSREKVDVRVQLAEGQRGTVEDLRRINVNPEVVPPIPLDTVATLVEAEGPSEIRRVDQQRAVVVSGSVAGFDLGTATDDIAAALARIDLPEGTEATLAGQSAEMEASLSSLQFALLLAIFLVYVIMASTFEDVVQPFVILLSVPLAVVGVAATLFLVGLPISVVVLIGGIVLAGVVVNNAIVFVDTINRQRDRGLGRTDAIREAGRLRLRPILVTTVTTVLGLLPLSLGFGEGAEIQQPLAITVVGGLLSSTLLTLVVVPVVYRLLTRRRPPAAPEPAPSGAEEPA